MDSVELDLYPWGRGHFLLVFRVLSSFLPVQLTYKQYDQYLVSKILHRMHNLSFYFEHCETSAFRVKNFNTLYMPINLNTHYCTPTFIRMWEIFARFMRATSWWIFLSTNKSLSFACYNNMSLYKTWPLLWTLVVTNQFIGSKSRNKNVAIKSCFTVTHVRDTQLKCKKTK